MSGRGYRRATVSRRRLLVGLGAGLAGAAVLSAACSGDTSEQSSGAATSGPAATAGSGAAGAVTATPRRGGTLAPGLRFYTNEIPTLDPHATSTSNTLVRANGVYSRLLISKPGAGYDPTLEGDLAASWEQADPLTWTFKLNTKAAFHAPVSRPITSEDVVFSFNRLTGKSGGKPGPNAFYLGNVDAVTAPDATTVVYKLKAADPFFAYQVPAHEFASMILPKETGTAFDPAQRMVGTGPWVFKSYETGSKLTFSRNPQWHRGPELPYFDEVVYNIVTDQTAKLNFFLGGNLDYIDARGVDLAPITASIKGAQANIFPDTATWGLLFQFKDIPANAPWKDARVRRAISLAVDRDSLFEAANEANLAKKAGFKVDVLWPTHLGSQPRYYVDPRGKDVEPEAADNFKFNPQKAKALLAEAGYPNGFEMKLERNKGTYGDPYDNVAEALPPMLNAVGVRTNVIIRDHPSWFAIKNQLGVFDEAELYTQGAVWKQPVQDLINGYTPAGTGNTSHYEDQQLDQMIKSLIGKDDAMVLTASKQLTSYLGKKMYTVPLFPRINYYVVQPKLRGPMQFFTPSSDYQDFDKNIVRYWRDA